MWVILAAPNDGYYGDVIAFDYIFTEEQKNNIDVDEFYDQHKDECLANGIDYLYFTELKAYQ